VWYRGITLVALRGPTRHPLAFRESREMPLEVLGCCGIEVLPWSHCPAQPVILKSEASGLPSEPRIHPWLALPAGSDPGGADADEVPEPDESGGPNSKSEHRPPSLVGDFAAGVVGAAIDPGREFVEVVEHFARHLHVFPHGFRIRLRP